VAVAGLKDVQLVGSNPLPTNLQYLKDKQGTVELGADLNTLAWTAVDTAARLMIGQKLQRTWSRAMLWCTSSSVT
jgi:ribose transport system substrate-binding protein